MCGIIATISEENSFQDLYEGLYHLQHRGQDSFGISYLNNSTIETIKYDKILADVNIENSIEFNIGIGHVRYPTTGDITINECQPFYLENKFHNISIIHNGQIIITEKLVQFFKENNIKLDHNITSDSIYLLHLLSFYLNEYSSLNYNNLTQIIKNIQNLLEGSYNCICIINTTGLICFKDKQSIRPLIYGKKDNKYIISSESVSLTSLDYNIVNDIYGNELLFFDLNNRLYTIQLNQLSENNNLKPCLFEWVYLAREESIIYNVNVYQSRIKMGEFLVDTIKRKIDPHELSEIDYIVPVPDTSKPIALSISKGLNIPYYEAITKNRYVKRTFIMNNQSNRKKNIKRKLNVVNYLVQNKNLLIVDDSIVRGNTFKHIISLLRENGVNKIYFVSSSPPIINKNIYGIDIPDKKQLLMANKTIEKVEEEFNIKLIFQDIKDLKASINIFNNKLTDFEESIFNS